jgi:hypothetical protein
LRNTVDVEGWLWVRFRLRGSTCRTFSCVLLTQSYTHWVLLHMAEPIVMYCGLWKHILLPGIFIQYGYSRAFGGQDRWFYTLAKHLSKSDKNLFSYNKPGACHVCRMPGESLSIRRYCALGDCGDLQNVLSRHIRRPTKLPW